MGIIHQDKVEAQTPTVPVCVSSGGGGTLPPGGTVEITMTANTAVDSGKLDVYNRENWNTTYNIPNRVRVNGAPLSLTNGTLSTDHKTVTFQVSYDDLSSPDSNYNYAYLKDVQLNGVFTASGIGSSYDVKCVQYVTLDPRPINPACVTCTTPGSIQHLYGNTDCNETINGKDFYDWIDTFVSFIQGLSPTNWRKGDFVGGYNDQCDNKVDIVDFGQLYWGFVKAHNGQAGLVVPTSTPTPNPTPAP